MSDIHSLIKQVARNSFKAGFYAGLGVSAVIAGALLLIVFL